MVPPGFGAAFSESWSHWVLEHGLPDLPERLADGESVPVAWWTGPESAAVLHVRRWVPDEPDGLESAWTEVDVQVFERADGDWAIAASGGAGGWPDPSLRWTHVPEDHASLSGVVAGGWTERPHVALWGEVGTAAATLEVEQDGRTTTAAIVSPLGWVVVSAAVGGPCTARVRDAAGRVLAEERGLPPDW